MTDHPTLEASRKRLNSRYWYGADLPPLMLLQSMKGNLKYEPTDTASMVTDIIDYLILQQESAQ